MNTFQTAVPHATGFDPLTDRIRSTWTDGDFGRIAHGYERGAAEFVARLQIKSTERVLDVACGTGNLTIPAGRTGARVAALDIAPNLLSQLAQRAQEERIAVEIREGNCEALPFADASFDVVITMFGAMFAGRPERAGAELVRVCRPGGRIAMANWTATGFIGDMLKATAAFAPPPPGVPSPLQWGTEEIIRDRLGDEVVVRFTRRMMTFEYPFGAEEVVEHFRRWYGPTKRAFDVLQHADAETLRQRLVALWSENNRATDGTTRVDSEYLEALAFRS